MAMKQRPIIFSAEMVRAILAGTKTQTRRVIRNQPIDILPMPNPRAPSQVEWVTLQSRDPNHGQVIRCRYGIRGDRLWVRETWGAVSKTEYPMPIKECNIEYRAYLPAGSTDQPGQWSAEDARGDPDAPHWMPSIHMPRWASRITLEIVGVRAERLQDMKPIDCVAEGAYMPQMRYGKVEGAYAIARFAEVWDWLNAKRGYPWESDPWVWVISFKRIQEEA